MTVYGILYAWKGQGCIYALNIRKEVRMIKKIIALIMATVLLPGKITNAVSSNEFIVTAYCPCKQCSEGYGNMTATGVKAKPGITIAVDPKVIPYGSTVLIYYDEELFGIYIAEDCGGAIKGKMIDIYCENHEETIKWGKRKCQIKVYPNAKG